MIARRTVLTAIAAAGALPLTGCGSIHTQRYRMTVEVETPQGLCSGSAVREISHRAPSTLPIPSLAEDRPSWHLRGEAVAVDLPGGQTLFALLSSGDGVVDYAGRDIWFLFRELGGEKIVLWPNPPTTKRPMIADPLPMLVRFADITDPASVEKVDPDNLAAAFGPSVKLRRISVELTDDAVSTGIDRRFIWLDQLEKYRTDPNNPFTSTLPTAIGGLRSQ